MTGETSSRWRRDATSGTTPPKRACNAAWDETTFARISPSSVTSAAAVSSQDVSIPKIMWTASSRFGVLSGDRVAPHDQRVLAVVGVVAAPDAARDKAHRLVQLDRTLVGHADLERVAAALVRRGQLEEVVEQSASDPAAAVRRHH